LSNFSKNWGDTDVQVRFTNAGVMSKSLVKKLMRMNLFSFGKGNEFRSIEVYFRDYC